MTPIHRILDTMTFTCLLIGCGIAFAKGNNAAATFALVGAIAHLRLVFKG